MKLHQDRFSVVPDPVTKKHASLESFDRMIQETRREVEAKQAELELQTAKAYELQQKLAHLNREVDDCADRLALAESQCASFQAELSNCLKSMLNGWGNTSLPSGPNYQNVVRLKAAIEDFPRVRASLDSQLRYAERALAAFVSGNDLN